MINAILLIGACLSGDVYTFRAGNSYAIDRAPNELVGAMVDHARTCELSARVPRVNLNADIEIGVIYNIAPNNGVVWAQTRKAFVPPLPPLLSVTIHKVVYRAEFQLQRDRILIRTSLRADVSLNHHLTACFVERGRKLLNQGRAYFGLRRCKPRPAVRAYCQFTSEAGGSLTSVLASNERNMRHIAADH